MACHTGDSHLGLEARGYKVLRLGHPGMSWKDVLPSFQLTFLSYKAPDILVFNIGGNDITTNELSAFRCDIIKGIKYIESVLPSAKFIWFDILPRLQ